jgi:hypothetical protein
MQGEISLEFINLNKEREVVDKSYYNDRKHMRLIITRWRRVYRKEIRCYYIFIIPNTEI